HGVDAGQLARTDRRGPENGDDDQPGRSPWPSKRWHDNDGRPDRTGSASGRAGPEGGNSSSAEDTRDGAPHEEAADRQTATARGAKTRHREDSLYRATSGRIDARRYGCARAGFWSNFGRWRRLRSAARCSELLLP